MATAPVTEEEFLRLYRDTLATKRTEIVQFLEKNRVFITLVQCGALSKDEWGQIEAEFRRGADQARETVQLIEGKGTLNCYIALSRVICDRNSYVGKQLFPFVERLGSAHPPLKGKGEQQPKYEVKLSREDSVVVWLVTTKADHDTVCQVLEHFEHPCERTSEVPGGFLVKEYMLRLTDTTLSPMQLCVVCPKATAPDARTVTSLLSSFSPKPWLAVLSGTCIANQGYASLGDVVVVTRSTPLPVSAEVQHMTEIWRLKEEASGSKGQFPQNVHSRLQQMYFLARLYAELKSSHDQRSLWFKNLSWDSTKPYSDNPVLKQLAPNVDDIWQNTSKLWKAVEGDVLPFAPAECLLTEARASMHYAYSMFPLPCHTNVVFGKAGNTQAQEGTIACSREVVSFYQGAQKIENLEYVAAMGVSGVNQLSQETNTCCTELAAEYATFISAMYLYKIVEYMSTKLC